MIKHYGSLETRTNFENFIQNSCAILNIDQPTLFSKTRKREIVKKRQCLSYILHKKAGMRSIDVGYVIGGCDHATVLHSCKSIPNDLRHKYQDTLTFYNTIMSIFSSLEKLSTTEIESMQAFNNCPQF